MTAALIAENLASVLVDIGESMLLRKRSTGSLDPGTLKQVPGAVDDHAFQGFAYEDDLAASRFGLTALSGREIVVVPSSWNGSSIPEPIPGDAIVLVSTGRETSIERSRREVVSGSVVFYECLVEGR